MNKVLIIGSLNMDLVIEAPKLPVIGETLLGSGFITTQGGKGANQAVAMGRLGGNVAMLGCVGGDEFGRQLILNLQNNNVNVEMIKTLTDVSSGVAVITVVGGNNCIIVNPGANGFVSPEMVQAHEEEIKGSAMIVMQMEIPYESVVKATTLAKQNNVKVLLNPAPARPLPDELLKMVDIITPNETECEIITGIKINSIDDARTAVRYLMNKGISQVLVTLGKDGVVYNSKDTIIHQLPPETKAVDTTAAGDSFTAAIALKLTLGDDIDTAVRFANQVGALTVSKKGAQASLPTLAEVNQVFGS